MNELKKAELFNIDKDFEQSVKKAKEVFLEGKVFVYPTDTIYGLGANPFNDEAVKLVSKIKGRPENKKYILLIDNLESLQKYVDIDSERNLDFLQSVWPNPVSVILRLNNSTKSVLKSDTYAFRIPSHRFCIKLLSELKMPLISTSANRSEQSPILEPALIRDEFIYEVEAIFYSEKKPYIESSTIIDLSGKKPILIREGRIKFNDLVEKYS